MTRTALCFGGRHAFVPLFGLLHSAAASQERVHDRREAASEAFMASITGCVAGQFGIVGTFLLVLSYSC